MEEAVVLDIIAKQIGVSPKSLQEETSFADLGADSLDLFQIVSALEETYDIDFDPEVAENLKTIQDVLDYLRSVLEN